MWRILASRNSPFVIDSTGNIGPKATKLNKFIDEVSGVSVDDTVVVVGVKCLEKIFEEKNFTYV